MVIATAVLAALAAVLHVYIFVLESVRWTEPATRAIFGISEEDARVTLPLAYNQGFYNLFLAVVTVVGIAVVGADRNVGLALIAAGAGSMLAAALVLILSDRSKARAAIIQGTLPLLTVAVLLIAW